MKRLLQAEVIKLRTTRTFLALAGAAVAISLLLTVLTASIDEPTRDDVVFEVFASDMSSIFIAMLAVVGITGEWRHRTITSSLLAAPDRLRFLAAKVLAFGVVGLSLSLVVSLVVAVAGFSILGARDLPTPGLAELADLIGHNALGAFIAGAFGVCVGALVRNQVVAVVGVLLAALLVEPLLLGLVPDVARFGPFIALPTAMSGLTAEETGFTGVDLVAPGVALMCLLAWIAAVYAAGAALLRARDLN